MVEVALDHLLDSVLTDDLFTPDKDFSPTQTEVDTMNRVKETAEKATKFLDTVFGRLADILKTI